MVVVGFRTGFENDGDKRMETNDTKKRQLKENHVEG